MVGQLRAMKDVVLFTGVEDMRVEDHGGLWAAAEASAWTPVLGVGSEVRGLRKRILRAAAEELDGELRARYGVSLAVTRLHDVERLAEAGATVHVVDASGVEVKGCRRWSSALREEPYEEACEAFEAYCDWARAVKRRAPAPAPDKMPEAISWPEASQWNLLEDDEDTITEPYAELALACCGCVSSGRRVHEYLRDGRDAFTAKYMSRAGGSSLYAAAAQWVAGDAPAARLAQREAAERAFGAALAVGGISKRSLAAAAAASGARFPAWKWASVARSSPGALLDVVEWREWHGMLRAMRPRDAWWCWSSASYDVRHIVFRSSTGSRRALLFVHGFGADADQWARLAALVEPDCSLFAVDLVGFGYSAKPGVSYTQHLWEAMIGDFAREVVLRDHDEIVLVGNSIGGGLAAGLAANLGRPACAGLVLCNTAGTILDEMPTESVKALTLAVLSETDEPRLAPFEPPAGGQLLIDAFGQVVIEALAPRIKSLLQRYYPTNPGNADDRLADAIERAARDPGANVVIASGTKLPPQRSLNEVFADFGGPVLVPQGELDYVSGPERAKLRADQLAQLGDAVTVHLLQSGHCPHDESPELVAGVLNTWLRDTLAWE